MAKITMEELVEAAPGPMWFDPAPPGYPWTLLYVPTKFNSPDVSLYIWGSHYYIILLCY